MCGEYVGTVPFLYFALSGCQVANTIKSSTGLTVADTGANPQQLQYLALSFGFSLAVNAWVVALQLCRGTFIAPIGIGLSLFVAELTGVYFTGGSLNPARSFGPAVVNRHFEGYHWIYWAGPILGAAVAAGFYKFIKILEYETANPDQDAQETHMIHQADYSQSPMSEKKIVETQSNDEDAYIFELPSKTRMASPAMATTDEAFHGLDGGMHADEVVVVGRPRHPRTVSRIV
ncbi:aquaporin-like protein [Pleomassaria siparia CBS 279.74]|uniref:Aquaporin-like protein n=1 Tax=Pleomassaria siparia CBS 279.74 TaxID=1314801 RepID=A0A6G1KBR5_9PLEO|nr:aquaporin-like protein [Pleomassaria siparia CBS 279.74]